MRSFQKNKCLNAYIIMFYIGFIIKVCLGVPNIIFILLFTRTINMTLAYVILCLPTDDYNICRWTLGRVP